MWKSAIRGPKMYRLVYKLKRVKIAVKEWNRKENQFSYKKLEENQMKLSRLQEQFVEDPSNTRKMDHFERPLK